MSVLYLNGKAVSGAGGSIAAEDVTYGESNVKDALDKVETKEIEWSEYQSLADKSGTYIVHNAPDVMTVGEVNDRVNDINNNLKWSDVIVLSDASPTVWYKYNSLFVYVYVNTGTASYTSETTIGRLPNNLNPLEVQRVYRDNGYVSVDTTDGISVKDIPTWTVASFMYPRN